MSVYTRTSTRKTSALPDIPGLGGALAGLGGGAVMAIAGAITSLAAGNDIWLEAKQIAAGVMGQGVAALPGFAAGPVIVGTILHFLIAGALGAVFGILVGRILKLTSDFGMPIIVGLIYGFALWLLAYFVILPVLNPALRETYAPTFIIQHLLYGVVTGLLYMRLRPRAYTLQEDDLA